MKKSVVALCLMLGFSGALAEQSGFFGGVGLGLQGAEHKTEVSSTENYTQNTRYPSISLFAGYKMLEQREDSSGFGKLGVRIYANYEYNPVSKFHILKSYGSEVKNMGYHIVGLNFDNLFNFTDSFAAFLGANVGAVAWDEQFSSNGSKQWGAYFAFQFGVRALLSNTSSVEFIAKIPATRTEKDYMSASTSTKNTLGQRYNFGLRYVMSF